VVSDIPVDDEAPVVTSRISRSVGVPSFGGAHRGRVCVRVVIGVSVGACCERLRCTVSSCGHPAAQVVPIVVEAAQR
jgi:hypothetical protein